jgi:hypothetical protein
MKISRRQLRQIIAEIAIPVELPRHRTMSGITVPFGCEECIDDIDARINDAVHSRDQCPLRSADRTHYNGILNLLRRDRRHAIKHHVLHEDADYLAMDDISVSSADASSSDEQEMEKEDIQDLTAQRQKALDQGDAVTANALGTKLAMLRKKHG